MKGRTYEKAKRVVKAAEQDPERHAGTVKEMDRTGNVDAAYKKVKPNAAGKGETPGMSERENRARTRTLNLAHQAVHCLHKIRPEDPWRERAFQIVSDFIASQRRRGGSDGTAGAL
jgi:hypothetical protein